jgi:hypothetical protein
VGSNRVDMAAVKYRTFRDNKEKTVVDVTFRDARGTPCIQIESYVIVTLGSSARKVWSLTEHASLLLLISIKRSAPESHIDGRPFRDAIDR